MRESMPAGGNLPRERTSFVGRRHEVTEVKQLLAGFPLVTVTGLGGVGKTRVALRAARELMGRFADGVWLVELSGLHDADLLGHVIADVLPVIDQTARPMHEILTGFLADKNLLLVLDTCEHLADDCARLAVRLIREAPELRVLATSRQLLGAVGEREVFIPPLPVPDPELPEEGEEALTLFAQRAAAASPGFTVTEQNRAAVARVCRRLEGIPLAIELAAVRLGDAVHSAAEPEGGQAAEGGESEDSGESGKGARSGTSSSTGRTPQRAGTAGDGAPDTDGLRWLAEHLDDRLGLLTTENGSVPPRHRALRTTIGWSHELCSAGERLLWTRLSVFSGRFDLPTATAVCADDALPARSVGPLAERLVARSVLIREGTGSQARYRMLDTVREYGRQWLGELRETEAMLRRHRDHYRRVVREREADCLGPGQAEWYARISRDHTEIRAALDFCLSDPAQARPGLDMVAGLWFYWLACGHLREGRLYLERALAASGGPSPERRKALFVSAWCASNQGDFPTARALAEECRAEAEAAGDTAAAADASAVLGSAALLQGDLQSALPLLRAARERLRASDSLELASIHASLAWALCLTMQDLTDAALAILVDCDLACERHGEVLTRSNVDYGLALAERARGDTGAAAQHARAALRTKRRFRDTTGYMLCIGLLGWLAAAEGDAPRAARLIGASEQIARQLGTRLLESPFLSAEHQACVLRARSVLGEERYGAAFREGQSFTLDHAAAYALGEAC